MTWYEKIIKAHTDVTDAVGHFVKLKADRYFVWQEDGSTAILADDKHGEIAVTGTTDLFTMYEFDPWKTAIEKSFDNNGIAWFLNSVQFEEDTVFIHYEWRWEVL